MLGVFGALWGSGIAELARMAWRFSVGLWTSRLLTSLEMVLLRNGDRFIVNPAEFTRPDLETLAAAMDKAGGGTPWMATPEIRYEFGLSREPDGDLPERRESVGPEEGKGETEEGDEGKGEINRLSGGKGVDNGGEME